MLMEIEGRRCMKIVLCALALLLLAGCSSVVMEGSFPDSTLSKEDMDALRGTWQLDNGVVYLNFTTNGMPIMSSVEWTDNRFMLMQHDLHIAKRNNLFYVSLLADPARDAKEHLFAACKSRDRELLVWGPDVDFFKNLVAEEKLMGSVRKEGKATQVRLSSPPAEILDLVATNSAAIDFKEPLIFKKLD
jgi:hypothetical protein